MLGIVLVTVLAFAAIGVRLFDLQARDRTHLASLGLGQRVRTVTIPAERGNIFDRSGKVLAVSVPQTTIVADPQRERPEGHAVQRLRRDAAQPEGEERAEVPVVAHAREHLDAWAHHLLDHEAGHRDLGQLLPADRGHAVPRLAEVVAPSPAC